MSTVAFILLCLGIILFGLFIALFLAIIVGKRKEPDIICEDNYIYRKFTDQDDVSINEVAKRFKQDIN